MENLPERFIVSNMEFSKSVTKEGMYRFKDEHGNTGYISEKEAKKIYNSK